MICGLHLVDKFICQAVLAESAVFYLKVYSLSKIYLVFDSESIFMIHERAV